MYYHLTDKVIHESHVEWHNLLKPSCGEDDPRSLLSKLQQNIQRRKVNGTKQKKAGVCSFYFLQETQAKTSPLQGHQGY